MDETHSAEGRAGEPPSTEARPEGAKPVGTTTNPEKKTALDDPIVLMGLKLVGGSKLDAWNWQIIHDTVQTLWLKHSKGETYNQQYTAALAGLLGIAPKDELEGMMAAQLIASHSAAIECYRRAMHPEQTFEGRRENLNQANKLSRTWTTLLEALNRHRGKGQQKVTVEHFHVHSGGQAVVGVVQPAGGGDHAKSEDQPHAKQIPHAPEPALWREDAEGRAVPVPRDGERPVPDARRNISGRADR